MNIGHQSLRVCLFTAMIAIIPGISVAEIKSNLYGFVSQTVSYSTANNYIGNTEEKWSADYREMGAGVTLSNNDYVGSLQLISRRAGGMNDGDIAIDHAFVGKTWLDDGASWLFALGKNKLPYGIYNETRDVPSTRPSILLPQAIYLERTRDLANSQLSARVEYQKDDLDFVFVAGKISSLDEIGRAHV